MMMSTQLLKTLRRIHLYILVLLIFMFNMCLVPNKIHKYKKAKTELELLDLFSESIYSWLDDVTVNKLEFFKENVANLLKTMSYQNHGIALNIDDVEIIVDYENYVLNPYRKTVDTYLALLSYEPMQVALVAFAIDEVIKEINKKKLSKNIVYKLNKIEMKELNDDEMIYTITLIEGKDKIITINSTSSISTYFIQIRSEENLRDALAEEKKITEFRLVTLDDFSNVKEVFIWDDVSEKSPEEAIKILDQRIIEEKNNIRIYGFDISSKFMVNLIPLLVLLLVLYFNAHILHLKSSTIIISELEVPWIALYDNFTSKLLTYLTLFILPFIMSSIITYIFFSIENKLPLLHIAICGLQLFISIENFLIYNKIIRNST